MIINLTIHDTITVLIDSFHSGNIKKIPNNISTLLIKLLVTVGYTLALFLGPRPLLIIRD